MRPGTGLMALNLSRTHYVPQSNLLTLPITNMQDL